jgi:hypothetical protein
MEKDIRVQRVAVKVHAVERSIDDTLALAAELMLEMHGACTDLNLAAQTSDGAFAKLIEAMTELQAARTSVVAAHKRMDKIREAAGLRPTAVSFTPLKFQIDQIEDERPEPLVAQLRG